MPVILCIETATKLCSVALGRDCVLLAEQELASDRLVHAEKINVFIDGVLREAGVDMRMLGAVAVGIGPGSYTGLRIGLSAAKGLCYALGIPIIGVSTLETLMQSLGLKGQVQWPMIDARRMEVFTQPFGPDGRAQGEAAPLILDEAWAVSAGPCTVFGDGADKATELWSRHPRITHQSGARPHARAMLALAEARLASGATDDLAYLVPLYGKEAKVTQPRKKDG
ncbi:MAG: tRNA (adenosine(37)-N6)-threonylcarbamoyltransferase complex dimerization subunit type 1 TsaB [Flavobacteriales bacterium]|nr:tRNA (adenosine(37)-N6)-threonylcarbamoyltransferase complex dimerization subunit type 1 TsaB [Flavobacteriales bacterium]